MEVSMRHRRTLLRLLVLPATAAVLFVAPSSARGQPAASPIAVGARLRVWSSDQRARAVLGTALGADSSQLRIELDDGSQVLYPWALVDSLHVSRGKQGGQGRRFALLGALTGGVALAVLAAANSSEGEVIDPAAAAGVSFVAGAALGALVGGSIGSARAEERWEAVPLRARVGTRLPRRSVRSLVVAVTLARFR
jgi:hypothetical protein